MGSNRFSFSEEVSGNPSVFSLQGNAILDTLEPTAAATNGAEPLLLENVSHSQAGNTGLAVFQSDFGLGAATGIGNALIASCSWNVDSHPGFTETVNPPEPVPPGLRSAQNQPVLEVAPSAKSRAIQAALDRATALCGQRPIVHLPEDNHSIGSALVPPAGRDVQLVGDGLFRPQLSWAGRGWAPVLRILGPSWAALRDLRSAARRPPTRP